MGIDEKIKNEWEKDNTEQGEVLLTFFFLT